MHVSVHRHGAVIRIVHPASLSRLALPNITRGLYENMSSQDFIYPTERCVRGTLDVIA